MALDTYFRGNSQELAFCQKIRAGGNHLVVATAGGLTLGKGRRLRLRQKELAVVLAEYRQLSKAQRQPKLPNPKNAQAARRQVPAPPPGGLILRGYCTYMRQSKTGQFERSKEYYYKENPDRWAAETQSDMLWLTRNEWQTLIPSKAEVGDNVKVATAIQHRFFSTIGIDYMEGSVNSLPPRKTTMSMTVLNVGPKTIKLRLDGYGWLGKDFDESQRDKTHSRGCEIRVLGKVVFDVRKQTFKRFDIVGIGQAWGMKRRDRRAIRIADYPWSYGIACELVNSRAPMDLIPPYNLLHYGSAGPYFGKK